jgi:hypothetical protein
MDKDFIFEEGKDYYLENGAIVLTERYHKKRGTCCGSGCRHCCFDPIHQKGNKNLKEYLKTKEK